jgi:hypothetical protein
MTAMTTWGFTLRLNREPTDEELDLLFEAGCDDSAPEGALLHFDREADTLLHAVLSASRDVSKVPGLRVTGVTRDDIVSLREVASRLDRTYESARLLMEGKRGPGFFPPPVIDIGFTKLYLWVEVEEWVHGSLGSQTVAPAESERDLALADAVLTVRNRLAHASRSERKEILELIAA